MREEPTVPSPSVVAVTLPSAAVCGLSRSCAHQASTSSCWTGDSLASQQRPVWSQWKRNIVGLHCKEGSQILDASPNKLEISLFYLGWN